MKRVESYHGRPAFVADATSAEWAKPWGSTLTEPGDS